MPNSHTVTEHNKKKDRIIIDEYGFIKDTKKNKYILNLQDLLDEMNEIYEEVEMFKIGLDTKLIKRELEEENELLKCKQDSIKNMIKQMKDCIHDMELIIDEKI